MPQDTQATTTESPWRHIFALSVVAVAFTGVLLVRGEGGAWIVRVLAFIETLIVAGWAPCLYVLAGAGYGRLARGWLPASADRWCIELGIGLTVLLTLTHLLGIFGMLGVPSAWTITVIGLVLMLPGLRGVRDRRMTTLPTPIHFAIVCGVMLAFVMACSPPGVLWGSEYGGFDALSYHLQLPREWIEQGRIWPSEHNVYSFLPSYVESAYAHIALMMGGGMLSSGARSAMSAQVLSAILLVLSAFSIGRLGRVCCARLLPGSDDALSGRVAIALTLGTPWLVVVGSLAYNEIAVVLLGSCALIAAMRLDIESWKRAIVCGVLVGGACSCKPTALFLLAPSVGVVLLACSARRCWVVATLGCLIAGGITILPWLVRNELATGNPMFPQMRGVFGDGHWTEAQHAVYASAHAFHGSMLDRFAMLLVPDPDGTTHVSRYRGLTNGQWGLIPALGLIGVVVLLLRGSTRRAGVIASIAVGIPLIAWAMLTHLQSRFLIPIAPVMIVVSALAVVRIPNAHARGAIAKVVCLFAVMWSVGAAMIQNRGNPFILLDLGPAYALGEIDMESLPWTGEVNRLTDDTGTVYLLGDATPFYVRGDVRYNTVYDHWLIEDAIAADPDDPSAWTRFLRDRGVDYVVVGLAEIGRYMESGWLPDSIDPVRLNRWMESLGQPILIPSDPSRVIFRIPPSVPAP